MRRFSSTFTAAASSAAISIRMTRSVHGWRTRRARAGGELSARRNRFPPTRRCRLRLGVQMRALGAPSTDRALGDSAGAYLTSASLELNRAKPGAVTLQVLFIRWCTQIHFKDEELRNFRFLVASLHFISARSLGAEALPSLLDDLSTSPPTTRRRQTVGPVRNDARRWLRCERPMFRSSRKIPVLMHGGRFHGF